MNSTSKVIWMILGLFVGMILAFFVGIKLLYERADQQVKMQGTAQAAAELANALTLTAIMPPPTATPDLRTQYDEIFYKAERAMDEYDLEKANAFLYPLTTKELSDLDNARLYGDLGKIEIYNGHARMACSFFEKQFTYEKTPLVLLSTAMACAEGGDLDKAMDYYQQIVDWPGSDADDYRDMAQSALDAIKQSLGLFTPTSSSDMESSSS